MTDNEKVFEMIPFPTDGVSCTCNFNKPSNVRCKWSKVISTPRPKILTI